jgi:FAD/FMN-containing dehydrogenase
LDQSWFEAPLLGQGGVIETPRNEDDVRRILTDRSRFPSPVRPMGSRHSMTPCIKAQAVGEPARWGTLVNMTGLDRLRDTQAARESPDWLRVDDSSMTVTVPAGRTFIDVARALRERGLQLRVITELGPLTMGAAACGATKESSFPGEPGQVCTDVVGMRLVRPNGEVEDLTEAHPDFEALRCSYGLFGIVTEVTFRVDKLQDIAIRHEKIKLQDFEPRSREWLTGGNAAFLYMFPYTGDIVAELRRKPAVGREPEARSTRLRLRNFFWKEGLHNVAKFLDSIPSRTVRNKLRDRLTKLFLVPFFTDVLDLHRVNPVDQIVDFDKEDKDHRFTFSMWAFPEAEFPAVLREYFEFCNGPRAGRFRTTLPHVSYHIAQDASSLLSYSRDGDVWTLDPIASGKEPDWELFLDNFNEFCSARGGKPLLNQTPRLQRGHVQRAFGERLTQFEETRRRFDPGNRMLNDYFAALLAG